jgi:hypothetical protein
MGALKENAASHVPSPGHAGEGCRPRGPQGEETERRGRPPWEIGDVGGKRGCRVGDAPPLRLHPPPRFARPRRRRHGPACLIAVLRRCKAADCRIATAPEPGRCSDASIRRTLSTLVRNALPDVAGERSRANRVPGARVDRWRAKCHKGPAHRPVMVGVPGKGTGRRDTAKRVSERNVDAQRR